MVLWERWRSIQKTTADLMIVSHVLEPLLESKEELNSWIEKVRREIILFMKPWSFFFKKR